MWNKARKLNDTLNVIRNSGYLKIHIRIFIYISIKYVFGISYLVGFLGESKPFFLGEKLHLEGDNLNAIKYILLLI